MVNCYKYIIIGLILFIKTGCFYLELDFDMLEEPIGGGEPPVVAAGPSVESTTLSGDNLSLQIVFSEPVFEEDDGEGSLLVSDFQLTFTQNGGGATAVSISGVSHIEGSNIVTLALSITGTPSGVEQIEVSPASNMAIYTGSGTALELTVTTGSITLSAPFLAGYGFRRKLTVDPARVPAGFDLTNFPVLLSLSGDYLKTTGSGGSVTNAAGYDIIFTGPDGQTAYSHQVESYNGSSGQITAWVKLPALYKDSPTSFYIYYGNGSISTTQESLSTVWTKYRSVWHMNETIGGANSLKNSASWFYNGTDFGGLALGQPGIAGNAVGFDGLDDYIALGEVEIIAGINPFSISLWVKTDGLPGAGNHYTIWDRNDGSNENVLDLSIGEHSAAGDGRLSFKTSEETPIWSETLSTSHIADNSWTHLAMVYDGIDVHFFINGVLDRTAPFIPPDDDEDYFQDIGRSRSSNLYYFKGLMDELRFSENTLSPSWIATEYSNQSSPGTFVSVGAEES